jgi:hypothetical protein
VPLADAVADALIKFKPTLALHGHKSELREREILGAMEGHLAALLPMRRSGLTYRSRQTRVSAPI